MYHSALAVCMLWQAIVVQTITSAKTPAPGAKFKTAAGKDKNENIAFVYGTLKSGEANHHQLFAKGPNGSVFLGNGMTVSQFPLIVTTPYNIPFLLHKEGSGKRIKGELYLIDDDTLKYLDLFEGHPQWYERRLVKAKRFTDSQGNKLDKPETLQVWLYGLPRFKKSLLELPQLEAYRDKDREIDKRYRPYNPEKDGSLIPYLFDD
ncbi:hypothetical protein BsWGS_20458 [Bradybaena similaris]